MTVPNNKLSRINFPISKDALDCTVTFNVIENHTTKFPKACFLRWNTAGLPVNCDMSSIGDVDKDTKRQRYAKQLPIYYLRLLLANKQLVDLPKKTGRDILLFFTSKESDSLYFVTHDKTEAFIDEDISVLTFALQKELEIRIDFHCTQPNYSKSFYYNIIPKSWNNVYIRKMYPIS